jgi:hypothetical protein
LKYKYIYIAHPISKGDVEKNINNAKDAATSLLVHGMRPFLPALDHDFDWILKCDALWALAMDQESPERDRKIAFAKTHNIPVFYSLWGIVNANTIDT